MDIQKPAYLQPCHVIALPSCLQVRKDAEVQSDHDIFIWSTNFFSQGSLYLYLNIPHEKCIFIKLQCLFIMPTLLPELKD